ncbi:cupin domain-containing protein, partial [Duffyella gerundensis]
MDPLSDVLSFLKVEAILTARMEARGPWAMRFPSYKHIKFGTVLEGNFWLWMDGMRPLLLEKGDFYLLTSGDAYCCGSNPALMVSDGRQIFSTHREADGVVRYGQGELISEGIGGRFVFEEASSPLLLKHLPPVLVSRREESSSPALTALITLLSHETSALRPGHDIVASSTAILVLVQMLREYLESNQKGTSWLNALGDRKIGA